MPKINNDQIAAYLVDVGQSIIMPRWRNLQASEVSEKTGPLDLVTIADKEAEAALMPMLQGALPGSLVLGEESFAADPTLINTLRTDKPVWIIDPVDGTRPFAQGRETFGTMVALVQNDEILAGWIHHPITGDTLMTERGGGAWWQKRRLQAQATVPLSEMFGILGVRLQQPTQHNPGQGQPPRFEYDSFVACQVYPAMLIGLPLFGRSEPYPRYHFRATASYSRPWDDAAGTLAIREAGGEVINWEGEAYRPTMFDNGTIAACSREAALDVRDWLAAAYAATRENG